MYVSMITGDNSRSFFRDHYSLGTEIKKTVTDLK